MTQGWVLDVSSLNEYVRKTLAEDPVLRRLKLRGEISNFKAHPSGHWYFTLKDEHSRIACVMFRQNVVRMSLRPADGMAVILSGSVGLYAEGGQYQFYADGMRPDGVGTLYQQFEALKAKLEQEGLFSEARKRPLPLRPRGIAVVTAETGAVLQDIRRVAGNRDPGVPLYLLPVQVQGAGAAEQIAAAIRRAGTLACVDVIIAGRGGGSLEDLWAFNEEIVARAIAQSPVPVISAVGHETDFTIADFVADVRASTPSNAAEMAVPDRADTLAALRQMRARLDQAQDALLRQATIRLLRAAAGLDAQQPAKRLELDRRRLDLCRAGLARAAQAALEQVRGLPAMARTRLAHAAEMDLTLRQERVRQLAGKLNAMDPRRVLERGYAMAMQGERIIADAAAAQKCDRMTIRFRDGGVEVSRLPPTKMVREDGHDG